ncbi:glycoside hydrolase family 18 protein [Mycena filopes]|nr:glycoside hydrolase family 18 protein [Mycena filopes]
MFVISINLLSLTMILSWTAAAMGATCSYILVQSGDGCAGLASRCGISGADFTKFNPSSTLCSTLQPGEPVCCSAGSLPDLTPQRNPDGTCATYTAVSGDFCAAIASTNRITVADIEDPGPICLSKGDPPMPVAVNGTQCGPQVAGTKRPSNWADISSLNPCPLNACCDKWGQCGITPDYCTASKSSTGAPGTSAPGTNGCISNCGTDIAFSVNRACLTMDPTDLPTGYSHVHYAFGSLTNDFQVDVSAYQAQFDAFVAMKGFKRVLSFGGWSFSTDVDSFAIFRQGVTDANRQTFAQSVVDTVNKYKLDGVDFDWEYPSAPDIPGIPAGDPGDGGRYLSFLKSFPIADMSKVVDYIVYMTYDLHGQWDYNNAFANPGCPTGNCLRSHVNLTETEFALAMITKAGVPASKVAVGIAGYGRSFGMVDPSCTGPACLFTGPNSTAEEGPCTGTAGYISQAELNAITSGTSSNKLLQRNDFKMWYDKDSDSDMMMFGNGTWVAYMSAATKASRISKYTGHGFAGAVEWAVDLVQFVAGQSEADADLSTAELESEFTAALALSNYDTAQFTDYDIGDLATRLIGWDKCTKPQRTAIYSGWQQSWKIMNLLYKEAKAGINFNEASAVEYLGAPALNEGQQSHFKTIFLQHATIQPGYIPTFFDWQLPVRCDDPRGACPCDTGDVGTTTAINFCPPYFSSPTLDTVMKKADRNKEVFDVYANLESYYPNQARTWYHELLHVDWATSAGIYGDNMHVTDLRMGFQTRSGVQYVWAYGATLIKSLARYDISTGWYIVRSADSMALYALARYVQKALGNTYPHLPLAGNPPRRVTDSFTVPGFFTVFGNGTTELEDSGKSLFSEQETTASNNGGVCSASSDVGGDPGADGNVATITANFALWAGLTATATTSATATPTPTHALSVDDVVCLDEADFPGHGDINPDSQNEEAFWFCLQQTTGASDDPNGGWTEMSFGDAAIDWTTFVSQISYHYRIEWVNGCITTVDKQNVGYPVGSDSPDGFSPCQHYLNDAYRDCNNGGVGGSIQAGCLKYSFIGAK